MNTPWRARYFTIWSGQQISMVGTRAGQFALVWWLTLETGSATVLATATMVAFIPEILLGPLIGTVIDRWNRRHVIFGADAVVALVSAALAWLSGLTRCRSGTSMW